MGRRKKNQTEYYVQHRAKHFDTKAYRKVKLSDNIEEKKKHINLGDSIIFNYGLQDVKPLLGKIDKICNLGVHCITECGWYFPLWNRITHVYMKKDKAVQLQHEAQDPSILKLFDEAFEQAKVLLSRPKKIAGKAIIIDNKNTTDHYYRYMVITYGEHKVELYVEQVDNIWEFKCKSSLTNKMSRVRMKNGKLSCCPIHGRINKLKNYIKKTLKKK